MQDVKETKAAEEAEAPEEAQGGESFWDQFELEPLWNSSNPQWKNQQIIEQNMQAGAEDIFEGTELPPRSPAGKRYLWGAVTLRLCKEEDLPQIMELDRKAFPDPWKRDTWERELQMPVSRWIVAKVEGHIAGYAGIWVVADEAQVMRIAVQEELRRLGMGSLLMDGLHWQALIAGADAMTLEVRESNITAQDMYKRSGFVSKGIRPRYYADTHEGAVIMWLEFPEEELEERKIFDGNDFDWMKLED